jgi:hypothetical protein
MVSKGEVYSFIGCRFSVYELYQWAKENLEVVSVGLSNIAKNYGFIEKEGFVSGFRLDKDYAKKLSQKDVEQPLLFVNFGVDAGCLMIDGTHRSFHRWDKGEEEADAYVIDNDDIILKHSSLTKKMLKAMRKG